MANYELDQSKFKYIGPRGARPNPNLQEGYRYTIQKRDPLTPTEIELGELLETQFHAEISRPQPYHVDASGERLIIFPGNVVKRMRNATFPEVFQADAAIPDRYKTSIDLKPEIFDLNGLNKETLNDYNLMVVFRDIAFTEMRLHEYSVWGQEYYGRIAGGHEFYIQWSRDEHYHEQLMAELMLRVAKLQKRQFDAEKRKSQENIWISPFETARQIAIYAYFQEAMTRDIYFTAAAKCETIGLDYTAWVLKLIGRDEAFHHGAFRDFVNILAKLDLEGTRQDLYYVLARFLMPSDPIAENGRERKTAYEQALGVDRLSLARRLFVYAKQFDFLDENMLLLILGRSGGVLKIPDEDIEKYAKMTPQELEKAKVVGQPVRSNIIVPWTDKTRLAAQKAA